MTRQDQSYLHIVPEKMFSRFLGLQDESQIIYIYIYITIFVSEIIGNVILIASLSLTDHQEQRLHRI